MRVLAIGAHPDDVELGCGATLARHAMYGDEVTHIVMTRGNVKEQGDIRLEEARKGAAIMGSQLIWAGLSDGELSPDKVHKTVEPFVDQLRPDVVYFHAPEDSHMDHKSVAQGCLSACRYVPTLLLYEAPSTLSFHAAIYVDVESTIDAKCKAIAAHSSQVGGRSRVNPEAIRAKARAYGFDARIEYAEAFLSPRALFDPHSEAISVARAMRPQRVA